MTPQGSGSRRSRRSPKGRRGVRRLGAALLCCLAGAGLPAGSAASQPAVPAPGQLAAAVIEERTGASPDTRAGQPAASAGPLVAADRSPTVPFPDLLPRTTDDAELSLRLDAVAPAVAVPDRELLVTVTVTNTGTTATGASVRLQVGQPLVRRADLDADRDAGALTPLGPAVSVRRIAPGASLPVTVRVPPEALPMPGPYGVLPLLVEASRAGRSSTLATYLPFEQRKEYEPLSVAVALPLTADPLADLISPTDEAREAAWLAATAPGSRLDRILVGTAGSLLTYAIDPALLGPASPAEDPDPAPPTSASTSPTMPPTDASTGASADATATGPGQRPADVTSSATSSPTVSVGAAPRSPAREAFARRLAAAVKGRAAWELPLQDPDLAATVADDLGPEVLSRLLDTNGQVRRALAPDSVLRVGWPALGLSGPAREALSTAYDGEAKPGEAARGSGTGGDAATPLVLPLGDVQEAGVTGDAARRFDDGTPVLAYDETLARLLADTASPSAAGVSQRLLAETMTILQEFPGRPRNLLLAAPRGVDPDPRTLSTLLGTLRTAPWLRVVSTDALVQAARHPDAAVATAPGPDAQPADPFSRGDSPLDRSRLDVIEADLTRVDELAEVVPPASTTPAVTRRSLLGLMSTRWRGQGAAWEAARTAVTARLSTLLGGVWVVPSQVNFFAEAGTLQVTVVNELDVEVRDVRVRLLPDARSPRLRLPDTPVVVSIPPGGRVTAKVAAEAVAAGTTLVSAEVSTPGGTRLGRGDATLTIQVQPTNGWVVLALGGAVGAVFVAGLLRTIRRNRPRVSAEDLKEIDLE